MSHILALKRIHLEKLIETLLKWKKDGFHCKWFPPHTRRFVALSNPTIQNTRIHVTCYKAEMILNLVIIISTQELFDCKKYVSNGIFGDRSIFLTNPSSAHKRLACKKLLQLYNLTTCQSCFVQFPWSSIRPLCMHNVSFTSEKRAQQIIHCGVKKYLHIDKIFTKACPHFYFSQSLLNLSIQFSIILGTSFFWPGS